MPHKKESGPNLDPVQSSIRATFEISLFLVHVDPPRSVLSDVTSLGTAFEDIWMPHGHSRLTQGCLMSPPCYLVTVRAALHPDPNFRSSWQRLKDVIFRIFLKNAQIDVNHGRSVQETCAEVSLNIECRRNEKIYRHLDRVCSHFRCFPM